MVFWKTSFTFSQRLAKGQKAGPMLQGETEKEFLWME